MSLPKTLILWGQNHNVKTLFYPSSVQLLSHVQLFVTP